MSNATNLNKDAAAVAPPQQITYAPHVLQAIQEVKTVLAHEGVGKNRQNTEQRFSFRGIDDILNALAAPMANASLAVFPHINARTATDYQSANGKRINHVSLDVTFAFTSLVDGSAIPARIFSEASDYSDKATNKAISFALKYAYISVFSIPVVGAEDGDFSSVGNEAEPAAAPAPVAKKAQKAAPKDAGRATPAGPSESPIVERLVGLDIKTADKLAALMQKAYGVSSVEKIPENKVVEALARIDTFLAKTGSTTATTQVAATSDDIPE